MSVLCLLVHATRWKSNPASRRPTVLQPYGLALPQHPVVPARKSWKKAFRDEDLSDMIVADDDLERQRLQDPPIVSPRAAKSMKIRRMMRWKTKMTIWEEEGEEEEENLTDDMSGW